MSSQKHSSVERITALCYVRQSLTRDGIDKDSPERQRANIQEICDKHGWTPEWYRDTDGHKSGRVEKNRPGWLALKARLGDPDVVAVVANDSSRLHRKSYRIGDLLEVLIQHGLRLVFAAKKEEIDLSGIMGVIFMQLVAIFDEWYAADISQRQKDSIAYRKKLGKVINLPFGTRRKPDGYLEPSSDGSWLMPDGSHVAGTAETSPADDAVWRSYYQCAERILTLYAQNKYGRREIAITLNQEGWAFRDRKGRPRPIDDDDVRRVISNWREYAGLSGNGHAKDRIAARLTDPLGELIDTGRNVFSLDLLRAVASVQLERSFTTNRVSPKEEAHDYALAGVLFCAHCAHDARKQNNPALQSSIFGQKSNQAFRYRHKDGRSCRANARSVLESEVDQEFSRLLHLLTVKESALALMTELAVQSQQETWNEESDEDPEEQ